MIKSSSPQVLKPSSPRLHLSLHAREEAVLHHLRGGANEPLTEARDRASGLHGGGEIDHRTAAFGAKRNGGAAFHESRPALPFNRQPVRRFLHFLGDDDGAVV